MEAVPRFRFAPSPTGTPHIGNLHTALFSWALARSLRGDFILRIEDSDPQRNTPAAAGQMLAALSWLGIDWDEGPDIGGEYGPYLQSQRLASHQRAVNRLLDTDHAYYGDDPERPADSSNQPLRLRLPRTGDTVVQDAIRGPIHFANETLVDPILVRSDGRPLYHLAAMVDDHEMDITHVVRGAEWIPSAPVHVRLYRALGWEQPVWIHLPLILNRHGQKLSKRDAAGGYLITDLQAAGYLPEAVFNYLLLLGWTPDGEAELVDKWIVRKQLHIERLSPSPAIFDWDKLNWVNRQYLQRLSDGKLAEELRPFLEEAYGPLPDDKWVVRLTGTIREGLSQLEEAVDRSGWAFSDGYELTERGAAALRAETAVPVLTRLVAELAAIVLLDEPTARVILQGLRQRLEETHGWSTPQIYHPIRAALTGDVSGPPLTAVMSLLGKQRSLQRLADSLKYRA